MGRKKGEREQEQEQEEQQKDAYMSNFHAIGKVLHAKRRSPLLQDVEGKEGGQEARGSLAFVPEDVLGKCEMEVDGLATFIQAHCVHHFGDLGELSHALGLFSDADVLLARVFSTAFTRPFLTSMCSPFWAAQLPAPIGTQSAAWEEEDEEEGLEE
eukprot:evm.model.NODE_22070_length_83641_cov_42.053585.5